MNEWSWRERDNDERAHGPFPTRDAAIEDALKADWATHIHVAKVLRPLPSDHVDIGLDLIMEHVALAYSDNYGWDGDFLDLRTDSEAAESELHEVLKAWARKHLACVGWCMDEDTEEVCLALPRALGEWPAKAAARAKAWEAVAKPVEVDRPSSPTESDDYANPA